MPENVEKPEPLLPKVSIQDIFGDIGPQVVYLHHLNYTSGNISITELMYLSLITSIVKPKRIVEFGTFNGRSTIALTMNARKDTEVITVDLPMEKIFDTTYALEQKQNYAHCDELGFVGMQHKLFHNSFYENNIKQIWCDTAEFPVDDYLDSVDLFFIDASHSYDNCKNDSVNAWCCLKSTGIILWHDYNGWPGVTKALNEFAQHLPLYWIEDTSFAIYKGK